MNLGLVPDRSPQGPRRLDESDRAIVQVLARSPRASYAEIGRSVGLSEASVRARVLRILDDESVVVTGRVDPRALGMGVVGAAFVQCGGASHETADAIGKLREVVTVAATAGRFDIIVEVRCRDADHQHSTLEAIRQVEGVAAVESCTFLRYLKQDWSQVGLDGTGDQPVGRVETLTGEQWVGGIDDIDRVLIAALVANGRATFADLGPLVDLSAAAVRARVLKLLETGVVTVQTITAPEAMGIGGYADVGVIVEGPVSACLEALARFRETTLVVAVAGRYHVLTEIWWRDAAHLVDILDRIRALPGVQRLETLLDLIYEKTDYSGGLTGLEGWR